LEFHTHNPADMSHTTPNTALTTSVVLRNKQREVTITCTIQISSESLDNNAPTLPNRIPIRTALMDSLVSVPPNRWILEGVPDSKSSIQSLLAASS
jgi:hypothetical protein